MGRKWNFCKRLGKKIFWNKWSKRLITGTLILHGATQLNYWRNDLMHQLNPSPQRAAFEEEFGFPIKGWRDEIEGDGKGMSRLAEVIHAEQVEHPFYVKSFRITSDHYLERSIPQQFETIFLTEFNGWCDYSEWYWPWGDTISLDSGKPRTVTCHEISHDKSFAAMEAYPEFKEKWEALATDEEGNSLYLGILRGSLDSVKCLEKLVDAPDNYWELGFVSKYSMKNVYEDMAELCERAKTDPDSFIRWFYLPEHRNDKIVAKTRLAAEYGKEFGLLPDGFEDYLQIRKLEQDAVDIRNISDYLCMQEFLDESEEFLQAHPRSCYECELRRRRGWAFIRLREFDRSREEYELALTADHKQYESYTRSLFGLAAYHKHIQKDKDTAKIYREAAREHSWRLENGDVTLPRTGVNDYLEERGIELRY
jgi:hypothetical protein